LRDTIDEYFRKPADWRAQTMAIWKFGDFCPVILAKLVDFDYARTPECVNVLVKVS